jgi:glycerophosphoryl diester phosphodiesterase
MRAYAPANVLMRHRLPKAAMKIIYATLIALFPLPVNSQTIITGHRGAAGLAPENTLVSVRKALELGVHRVEVDVQQTKDDVVICMHDRTLDRTTDMHGQIREGTWDELRVAKANVGFEQSHPDEGIPTLEEVMQAVNGLCELVIEIKDGNSYYPGIEDRVVELIKQFKAEKWALVHSFNDEALLHIHGKHPEIRLQKLFVLKMPWLPVMLDFRLHLVGLSDYSYVEAFAVHRTFITKSIIEKAHAMGKKVHVWTVNDREMMETLVDMGVDGIITDRPDIMLGK